MDTPPANKKMVSIAESEYTGLIETIYLMSSPKNYAILLESIAEFKTGKGIAVDFPFIAKT